MLQCFLQKKIVFSFLFTIIVVSSVLIVRADAQGTYTYYGITFQEPLGWEKTFPFIGTFIGGEISHSQEVMYEKDGAIIFVTNGGNVLLLDKSPRTLSIGKIEGLKFVYSDPEEKIEAEGFVFDYKEKEYFITIISSTGIKEADRTVWKSLIESINFGDVGLSLLLAEDSIETKNAIQFSPEIDTDTNNEFIQNLQKDIKTVTIGGAKGKSNFDANLERTLNLEKLNARVFENGKPIEFDEKGERKDVPGLERSKNAKGLALDVVKSIYNSPNSALSYISWAFTSSDIYKIGEKNERVTKFLQELDAIEADTQLETIKQVHNLVGKYVPGYLPQEDKEDIATNSIGAAIKDGKGICREQAALLKWALDKKLGGKANYNAEVVGQDTTHVWVRVTFDGGQFDLDTTWFKTFFPLVPRDTDNWMKLFFYTDGYLFPSRNNEAKSIDSVTVKEGEIEEQTVDQETTIDQQETKSDFVRTQSPIDSFFKFISGLFTSLLGGSPTTQTQTSEPTMKEPGDSTGIFSFLTDWFKSRPPQTAPHDEQGDKKADLENKDDKKSSDKVIKSYFTSTCPNPTTDQVANEADYAEGFSTPKILDLLRISDDAKIASDSTLEIDTSSSTTTFSLASGSSLVNIKKIDVTVDGINVDLADIRLTDKSGKLLGSSKLDSSGKTTISTDFTIGSDSTSSKIDVIVDTVEDSTSTPTVTLTGKTSTDSTIKGTAVESLVQYKIKADNEDVSVKDITVSTDSSTTLDISNIILIDKDGNSIGSSVPDSSDQTPISTTLNIPSGTEELIKVKVVYKQSESSSAPVEPMQVQGTWNIYNLPNWDVISTTTQNSQQSASLSSSAEGNHFHISFGNNKYPPGYFVFYKDGGEILVYDANDPTLFCKQQTRSGDNCGDTSTDTNGVSGDGWLYWASKDGKQVSNSLKVGTPGKSPPSLITISAQIGLITAKQIFKFKQSQSGSEYTYQLESLSNLPLVTQAPNPSTGLSTMYLNPVRAVSQGEQSPTLAPLSLGILNLDGSQFFTATYDDSSKSFVLTNKLTGQTTSSTSLSASGNWRVGTIQVGGASYSVMVYPSSSAFTILTQNPQNNINLADGYVLSFANTFVTDPATPITAELKNSGGTVVATVKFFMGSTPRVTITPTPGYSSSNPYTGAVSVSSVTLGTPQSTTTTTGPTTSAGFSLSIDTGEQPTEAEENLVDNLADLSKAAEMGRLLKISSKSDLAEKLRTVCGDPPIGGLTAAIVGSNENKWAGWAVYDPEKMSQFILNSKKESSGLVGNLISKTPISGFLTGMQIDWSTNQKPKDDVGYYSCGHPNKATQDSTKPCTMVRRGAFLSNAYSGDSCSPPENGVCVGNGEPIEADERPQGKFKYYQSCSCVPKDQAQCPLVPFIDLEEGNLNINRDSDNDGLKDFEERIFNTNPNDPTDPIENPNRNLAFIILVDDENFDEVKECLMASLAPGGTVGSGGTAVG